MRSVLNVRGLARHEFVRTSVADGDRGTAQTMRLAQQLVADGIVNPNIRELAVAYCLPVAPNDKVGEMRAIFNGALEDFRYIDDPVGWQLLQPPQGILDTKSGNCASLNLILLPSLLGSIGIPTRAVAIKADSDRPREFSHVYIEAQAPAGDWIPLDIARSYPAFGKPPDEGHYWGIKRWPITPGAPAGAMSFFFRGGLPCVGMA